MEKCCYAQEEVKFLSYRINSTGIMPEERVQLITNFPLAHTVMELWQFFLMLLNSNVDFTTSKKKNDKTPLKWTKEAKDAFYEFKERLHIAVLLYHPEEDAPIVLCCDASNTAIGGALH